MSVMLVMSVILCLQLADNPASGVHESSSSAVHAQCDHGTADQPKVDGHCDGAAQEAHTETGDHLVS